MTSAGSLGTQPTRIRLRRANTADWERINPVLADGEPGFERGVNKLKIGDGVTPWNQLSYLTPPQVSVSSTPVVSTGDATIDAALKAHVVAEEPHPVYDDGPSLVLLYKNAKV